MNWKAFLVFLMLNFLGLYLGSFATSNGVSSDWYRNLNQAPWTPPGWVFGAAWTSIMICFAFYMAFLWEMEVQKTVLGLFAVEWLLNFLWNPVFFHFRQVGLALVVLSALTLLVFYLMVKYFPEMRWKTLFILPYALWLLIACSLNVHVMIPKN